MSKILILIGTRPEAIKMSPLINILRNEGNHEVVLCVTGQHKELLYQALDVFGVKPDYDLEIMQVNQTLANITELVLHKIDAMIKEIEPNLILVHGDTTSAFAGALAGFYNQVKIGHVEAGLRTHDIHLPFPEEFNRQAIDMLCDYYFAPTEYSRQNLLAEDRDAEHIYITGNTGIDALAYTVKDDYTHEELEWVADSDLILLTAHRRENFYEPMAEMFSAVVDIVDEFPNVKVILPVHKNPIVRKAAQEFLTSDRIHVIEPLDVFDFHNFMARSKLILTDSGGIQEEAPSLNKPVLVMRDSTERQEGVASGTLKLVGTSRPNIVAAARELLTNEGMYAKMASSKNPYGDGKASERVAAILTEILN